MKLANSLMVVALMALCGCVTWERLYVAVHDAADEALTNAPPVVVKPPVADPAPSAGGCGCDLTKPLAIPPYTDAQLKAMGNAAECPQTKAGAGNVRFKTSNGHGGQWALGQHLDKGYDIDGKRNAKGKCFDADGGRYHFIGYSYGGEKMIPCDTATWFPYHWVTHIWFEFRK
jgi:hypothetical protein